jgi:hypothetical protein
MLALAHVFIATQGFITPPEYCARGESGSLWSESTIKDMAKQYCEGTDGVDDDCKAVWELIITRQSDIGCVCDDSSTSLITVAGDEVKDNMHDILKGYLEANEKKISDGYAGMWPLITPFKTGAYAIGSHQNLTVNPSITGEDIPAEVKFQWQNATDSPLEAHLHEALKKCAAADYRDTKEELRERLLMGLYGMATAGAICMKGASNGVYGTNFDPTGKLVTYVDKLVKDIDDNVNKDDSDCNTWSFRGFGGCQGSTVTPDTVRATNIIQACVASRSTAVSDVFHSLTTVAGSMFAQVLIRSSGLLNA